MMLESLFAHAWWAWCKRRLIAQMLTVNLKTASQGSCDVRPFVPCADFHFLRPMGDADRYVETHLGAPSIRGARLPIALLKLRSITEQDAETPIRNSTTI